MSDLYPNQEMPDDREPLHEQIRYDTVRGVTFPVEPGMSRLRRERERKKALKRMKADDRVLERFEKMRKSGQLETLT